MKRFSSLMTTVLGFLLLSLTVVSSVLAACPDQAMAALAAVDNVCQQTARNQACYGHALLEAEPQPSIDLDEFVFNAPGNQVDVAALRALRLMPMDATSDVWGVALLKLQANLPDNTAENVTMLLFGDARIENATEPTTVAEVIVTVPQAINVRSLASLDAGVIGTLQSGQIATALERVADNSWVRVRVPETGTVGWVSSDLVTGDIDTLNVVDAFAPHYTPMQAFYFQSGSSTDAGCTEAANGMIIQTPEGMGKVRLWMNEVRLQIGSTVYFQAAPNGDMLIRTLEGSALVEALGVTQNAVAGTQVRVTMDENLRATTPPSIPEPYDLAESQALPVTVLDRQIEVAQPLTSNEIATMQLQPTPAQCCFEDVAPSTGDTTSSAGGNTQQNNPSGCGSNCSGNSTGDNNNGGNSSGNDGGNNGGDGNGNNGGGRPNCPGNSCNAPGHNKGDDKAAGLGLGRVVRLIRDVLD